MGDLYGNKVRIITAISGLIGVIGIISVQLRIGGMVIQCIADIDYHYGIIIAGLIITFYSAFGGVRSVTFTDVIQFFTFGAVVPSLAYYLLESTDTNVSIIDNLSRNPLFDYKETFNLSNVNTYYNISLFLFFVLPSFNPAIFQRIAMSKNVNQVIYSFSIASIAVLILSILINWIGVLLITQYPGADLKNILSVVVNSKLAIIGFKGLILSGIMAMVMSTVDSFINSSSILLVHDLGQSLKIKFFKNELTTTRIGAMFIGTLSILFSMSDGRFMQLFIWANMFYMPVVSVPFIMTIFGFRTSGKSVLIAMCAGFCAVILWENFIKVGEIDGLIPGMFTNLVTLISSHYILKQPGGWVGIKNIEEYLAIKKNREEKCQNLKKEFLSFNLLRACKKNVPQGEGVISMLNYLDSKYFSAKEYKSFSNI